MSKTMVFRRFGTRPMGRTIQASLLAFMLQVLAVMAVTNPSDASALKALKDVLENTPPNWNGLDPCGDGWVGITCDNTRVIYIQLLSMGLKGQLSGDIENLPELQVLDLSYNKGLTGPIPQQIGTLKKLSSLILIGCSFYGPIPDSIGSLPQLIDLSLNNNSFNGNIPRFIGNLSSTLSWLDLADNQLTGTIPVSEGNDPGLDLLHKTKHFHFGNNRLSGNIPSKLFSSNMNLIHVLFEGNELNGSIPSTLGLVNSLEVVRFDRNFLSGTVPTNLNNLTNVRELHLSNNYLIGSIPNLTGMNVLYTVDMSNNSFDASGVPPWFSTLLTLTTLAMEKTQLQGELPQQLFSFAQLQTVNLRNNLLNGTLNIRADYSNQLKLINLQNNSISGLSTAETGDLNYDLILVGNPVCNESTTTHKYCSLEQQSTPSPTYETNNFNCVPIPCPPDQKPSPRCKCSYPYMGTLIFRAPSFSDLGNNSHFISLESQLMSSFQDKQLLVDSVSLSNPRMDSHNYLELDLSIFPSTKERFGQSDILNIASMFSSQTFKPSEVFGPFFLRGSDYGKFAETSEKSKKSLGLGIIIGMAAAGGFVLIVLFIFVGVYVSRQKRSTKYVAQHWKNPFESWDPINESVPQLKGARWFSFDELSKCTNNFSDASDVGSGGYGKVYRGILSTGQLVAIKRAQIGSTQGGLEFKTEIELLSRVHHKNLVSLVGFCFEQGEQMLVYEFIPNGSLTDSLTGKSGIRLDWKRRLQIALGSARGLVYLHELANPPIIHRDIKSNNILLDDRLNAKVADFGLSKVLGNNEKVHVTTQVKGTLGYLDPEYYMTQQLTEKSDVYSFGVLMLELITARKPIVRGKYIVRLVRESMDKTKDLYNLHELLDPTIGSGTTLGGFNLFVDLAMRCVQESGADRPTMSEVMKEIENIVNLVGLNPNAESATSSASYEVTSKNSGHPYSTDTIDHSPGYTSSREMP